MTSTLGSAPVQRAAAESADYARFGLDAACVHHLFEAQVARTPESVALLFDGDRVSYGKRAICNRRYVPKPYPGGVTMIAGMRSMAESPDDGVRRIALGGVEIREIPGDYVKMLVEPHVRVLARREAIDDAVRTASRNSDLAKRASDAS